MNDEEPKTAAYWGARPIANFFPSFMMSELEVKIIDKNTPKEEYLSHVNFNDYQEIDDEAMLAAVTRWVKRSFRRNDIKQVLYEIQTYLPCSTWTGYFTDLYFLVETEDGNWYQFQHPFAETLREVTAKEPTASTLREWEEVWVSIPVEGEQS